MAVLLSVIAPFFSWIKVGEVGDICIVGKVLEAIFFHENCASSYW